MFGPLVTLVTTLMTSAMALVPLIVGAALLLAGAVLAFGSHHDGKRGVICALVGGAVMATSQAVGAGIHV